MWLVLSLIAILFWSGTDLFCKLSSKPEDKYSHYKIVMAVGGIMGLHALYMLCTGMEFHWMDFVSYMPAIICYIVSMVLGYIGLRYIELSISTPICNSSGAVTVLLCIVLMKERMAGMQYVGMVLVFAAVLGISFLEKRQQDEEEKSQTGKQGEEADGRQTVKQPVYTNKALAILFSMGYCILDGLGTYVDAWILSLLDGIHETTGNALIDWFITHPVTSEEAANTAYELSFLLMAVISFIYMVGVKKVKLHLKEEKTTVLAGICETVGQFFYIYALAAEPLLASGVISSYCIFSVLWARLIIKEKLHWQQYLAIGVAMVGIVILGVYDA